MTLTETATPEPWVPSDSFGARLALVRQHLGAWNVAKTADFCGVDAQSWRNWEAGKSKPRDYYDVCLRVARETGCDLTWLMQGTRPTSGTRWSVQSPDQDNCMISLCEGQQMLELVAAA